MGDQLTPPEAPATPSEPAAPPAAPAAPERLPDDHPLVTALAAQKQKNADLQQQIDASKKVNDPKPAPKTKLDPGVNDDVSERIAALEKQLADAEAARSAAEVSALRTRLGAGLPAEVAALLTGTTEDEIAAQVAALTPHLKTGTSPAPNPQQGNPPGKTGGSVTAGRDRYKAAHNN